MEIVAGPVVSFVVERIGDWLIKEANLLTGVRSEVKAIGDELIRMKCFLKDAEAKHKAGAIERNFVIEIQDIAYDAEDVIETFVLMRERRGGDIQYFFIRYGCIFNKLKDRHNVGSKIKAIKVRISQLSTSLQTYGIRSIAEGDQGSSSSAHERQRLLRRTYSHVIEDDFIGLENDVKKLVEYLLNEDKDSYNWHQTVCICGMGGLGKTTLAQKVYSHKDVKRYFDGVAWACISQQLQKQDVLQEILIKFIPEKKDEIRRMGDAERTRELHQVLSEKKCLIVLDDIWEQGDWDILKSAFPIGKRSCSKILLTTRNKELALHVNPHGLLHEPPLLTEGEAWELLQKKALRRAHGSSDNRPLKKIEELGIKMVRHCGGLPLAVVVLGGILVTKHTEEEWEKVHRNINSHISKGTSVGHEDGGVSQVLGLSYDDLPFQLKRCFLYLGSFPEDSRIELEKLYELWIAEDLILSGDTEVEDTMMDVAERYLSELAQRYMVHLGVEEAIDIFGNYESLKYCRLHDMMRELSKSRSKEEIFFNVIDSEKISSSSSNAKVRRVAIHGHLGKEKNYGDWLSTHLRSVLLFGGYDWRPWHWKDLKVLRVVHLEVRELGKLPKAIGKLIHLRYLSLKGCEGLESLPSSIGNLRCLQTLDLRDNYMRIPNVLWKIKSLTHLYLCEHIKRQGKKMRLSGLGKLEILKNFDSSSCDVKDLSNLKNLRKLTARFYRDHVGVADFVNYLRSPSRLRHSSILMHHDFMSEEELIVLVECRHLNTLRLHGVIGGGKLPAVHHFSPSLTTLSLIRSELKEDPMLTLGKLPNLTHLTLGSAFEGVEMVCSEEGFPQLKFLRLVRLYNLEEWRVDEGAMPNLFKLQIINCRRLKMVPDGLKFISTLQELNIWRMPHEFVRRLGGVDGEEGEDQYKIQHG
ncbi:probable disease resistance protein At1g58602 isoform X2 [Cornus florida]|uniref:probable disease resistance protein At1g58602 isoform X2 n=1 Tax=Cornus florida TaxID=4283 RepID=UPI002897F583|nr:probable disease resistance protein At1g58602 isoform X2 [Cornus florida]